MAQCINFLQYKCIDLSSLPETHIKKSGMVPLQSQCWEGGIATYPGLTRGSLAESPSFRPSGRPCLKKTKRETHLFDEADEEGLAAICFHHGSNSPPQLTLSQDPGSPCLRMRRTCSSVSGSWPSPRLLQRSAFLRIVSDLVTHLITPIDLPRPPCRSSLLSPFSLPWPCCLPLPLTLPLPGLCHLFIVSLLY